MYGFVDGLESKIKIFKQQCRRYEIVKDACPKRFKCAVCTEVKSRDEGGEFDHLAHIPAEITDMVKEFVKQHQEPNTLFQMTPSLCHTYYRSSDYEPTKDFLRYQYWNFHTIFGPVYALPNRSNLELKKSEVLGVFPSSVSRKVSLNPTKLQIAVHIRRGDFFDNPDRSMIPDVVCADVIGQVKHSIDSFRNESLPADVRIYSEGWSVKTKDNHDVRTMNPIYLDENKTPRDVNYWINLTEYRMRRIGTSMENLDFHMKIASDAAESLHDMFSADFFIGSHSGLSMQIIRVLGRGIMVLPSDCGEELGTGKKYDQLQYSRSSSQEGALVNQELLCSRTHAFLKKFENYILTSNDT